MAARNASSDNMIEHRAAGRNSPVAIKSLAKKPVSDCVYHHVARTSVEGHDL